LTYRPSNINGVDVWRLHDIWREASLCHARVIDLVQQGLNTLWCLRSSKAKNNCHWGEWKCRTGKWRTNSGRCSVLVIAYSYYGDAVVMASGTTPRRSVMIFLMNFSHIYVKTTENW